MASNPIEQFARMCQRPRDEKVYKDSELVYAASARCQCGSGLAYIPSMGLRGYWDCSDILTGRAIPSGQDGSVVHSGQYPFTFYKIKSERQPSAQGATTRGRGRGVNCG